MGRKLATAMRRGRMGANRIGRSQAAQDLALKSLIKNHPNLENVKPDPFFRVLVVVNDCPRGRAVNLANRAAIALHVDGDDEKKGCALCRTKLDSEF
jgi:hypothetical protein